MPKPEAPAGQSCVDDASWRDSEGDGCSVYKQFISEGKLSKSQACNYGTSEAKKNCHATCGSCAKESAPPPPPSCEDDPTWRDVDGDNCKVYGEYITKKQLKRSVACAYNKGAASMYCKKTCETCPQPLQESLQADGSAVCADHRCVGDWLRRTGQCFTCADWPNRCNEASFIRDCPLTCGVCQPAEVNVQPTLAAPTRCEDSECIEPWRNASGGTCLKCKDFAADYCGNDQEFMEACPKSCHLCIPDAPPKACSDIFKLATCTEYKGMGWCAQSDISSNCRKTCGVCAESIQDDYPYAELKIEKKKPVGESTDKKSTKSAAAPRALALATLSLLALLALFGAAEF